MVTADCLTPNGCLVLIAKILHGWGVVYVGAVLAEQTRTMVLTYNSTLEAHYYYYTDIMLTGYYHNL